MGYSFQRRPTGPCADHKMWVIQDYGYRYYEPGTGRWANRDPIAESGGINLYEFADNNANNRIDVNGLKVNVFKLINSGKHSTTDRIWDPNPGFIEALQRDYGGLDNVVVDFYGNHEFAPTKEDVLKKVTELSQNKEYKRIFVFVFAHGNVLGNKDPEATYSQEQMKRFGEHVIALDSDVYTNRFNNDVNNIDKGRIFTLVDSCFLIPHYPHKANPDFLVKHNRYAEKNNIWTIPSHTTRNRLGPTLLK